MPSNRELALEATRLGDKLGIDVNTEGLRNADLMALVADLTKALAAKAGLDDVMPEVAGPVVEEPAFPGMRLSPEPEPLAPQPRPSTPVDGATGEPVAPPTAESPAAHGHFIAKGMSLTSLRGILGEHAEVHAKDFLHGQETLDHLVSTGAVVKR